MAQAKHVVGTQKKRLHETFLLSTLNMLECMDMKKNHNFMFKFFIYTQASR